MAQQRGGLAQRGRVDAGHDARMPVPLPLPEFVERFEPVIDQPDEIRFAVMRVTHRFDQALARQQLDQAPHALPRRSDIAGDLRNRQRTVLQGAQHLPPGAG